MGLVNNAIGEPSISDVEADVLTAVAGYGEQLGLMGDTLLVLLKHLPKDAHLLKEDVAAIDAMREMLVDIETVKRQHNRSVGCW